MVRKTLWQPDGSCSAPEAVLVLLLTAYRNMRHSLWPLIDVKEHYERYYKHRHAPSSLSKSVNR